MENLKIRNARQKYFYADAIEKSNDDCIETLVMDGSEPPRLIYLNSIVYSIPHNSIGIVTLRKGSFWFENFNVLVPLNSFDGANTNNPSQTNDLIVEHDEFEISKFFCKLFDQADHQRND